MICYWLYIFSTVTRLKCIISLLSFLLKVDFYRFSSDILLQMNEFWNDLDLSYRVNNERFSKVQSIYKEFWCQVYLVEGCKHWQNTVIWLIFLRTFSFTSLLWNYGTPISQKDEFAKTKLHSVYIWNFKIWYIPILFHS